MTKRCPHCQQALPDTRKAMRVCFDCRQPILLHDKWRWAEREGVLTCVHRHCGNPQSYNPPGVDKPAPAPLFDGEAA